MTKNDLVKFVSKETGVAQKDVRVILESITTNIGNALIHGDEVKISEFGTFKIKEVSPRRIVNITTGEYQMTKIRQKIVFNSCKELNNAIN